MSEPIRFYKGEETGIVHENYSDINTSLFKDQYNKALSEIGAYMLAGKEFTNKDLNNIFAFIGERGTGKTSCMESVSCLLDEISINKDAEKKLTIEEQKKLEIVNKKYLSLPIIDPTIFNDNTNLMQVVIGVMFEKFKDKVANSDSLPYDTDRDKYEKNKQNLLKAFQDVKECIKYISNPKLLNCEDDDISQLAGMASVSKLNDRIGKLADRYLEFFDKNILVLQIDDIDLQTKYAYRMVEEVRKYFLHKNIIILMAVKMEQLAKVIENETAKQYEPLKNLEGITLPEISDMAIRYLLKLIPINHRFYMPTAEVYVERELQYFENRNDENPKEKWSSVKYAITSLIYKKCRFLFYHSKGVTSPIVPRNLRELRHLLSTLMAMDDYDKSNPNLDNKNQFLNYFNNTWVSNNIDPKDYQTIQNILKVKDVAEINKVVLNQLHQRFKDAILGEYVEILNNKNSSYNISVADVYSVLEYIKLRINSVADKMLVFFVETFYSIKLYEYYDRATDVIKQKGETIIGSPIEQEDYELEKKYFDEDDTSDESIRKVDVVDGVSDFELFIGGSFINTDAYQMLPKERGIKRANDRAILNYDVLKEKASTIVGMSKGEVDEKELQIIEFFALCISRLSSSEVTHNNYRLLNDLYYRFDSSRKFKYVEFNLGSFFSNILNVKRAYYRVNPELYKYACNTDKSLYYKILEFCKNDRGDGNINSKHALMSCASIRNFEILSDFINRTQYSKLDRSEGNVIKNLQEFFKNVADYKIKTYDRDDDSATGKPTIISFKYAEKVANTLNNAITGTQYEELFNSIFVKNTSKEQKEKVEFSAFDIDSITAKFKSNEYATGTVIANIKLWCKPIFAVNPNLTQVLEDNVNEISRNKLGGKLDKNDIINVLTILKENQTNFVTKKEE